MQISKILKKIEYSPVKKLIPYALDAKKRNIKVYHLNIGDSDIKTPQILIENIKTWNRNPISYVSKKEENLLKESIINYLKYINIKDINNNDIQFSSGASEALLWTIISIFNINDEVILVEPFFPTYKAFSEIVKIKIKTIKSKIKNDFEIKNVEKEFVKKITKKTKAIILCNPSNPTGALFNENQLKNIVQIAKKFKIYVIVDEVYRDYFYEKNKSTSVLKFVNLYPKGVIVIDSLSKRYSLCGGRIGIIMTKNKQIIDSFTKYNQFRNPLSLIDTIIATNINKVPKTYLENIRWIYKERREALYVELKKIPNIKCYLPKGAFYMLLELPIKDSEHFCKWLLTDFNFNNETIMLAPASGFYKNKNDGKKQVRIAYVLDKKYLIKAANLLKIALIKYNKLYDLP